MNISIFYFLHSFIFVYPWLDNLVWFIAEPLIYILFVVATIFIILQYKVFSLKNIKNIINNRKIDVLYIPLATFVAWCFAKLLKILIHIDRPFVALPDIHILFTESGYAFPSGHATTAAALALSIFFLNKRLGYVFMGGALLIGLTRIASGVHYPVDILGGFILGAGVSFIFSLIFKAQKQ